MQLEDKCLSAVVLTVSVREIEISGMFLINGNWMLKVSVVGLERALEQYVTGKHYDAPFDIKVVPVSTQPLTATEKKKPALSVEAVVSKKEEKKASRQDLYAGWLCLRAVCFALIIFHI